MKFTALHTLGLLLFLTLFISCSEYQKVYRTEDTATKFKLGTELFEAGKYKKANVLFKQIVPKYRGKPQAEKLMYMYCKSFYLMEEYYNAGYQFNKFEEFYPKSEKAGEAAFLSAKCSSTLSFRPSKSQEMTKRAIEKLQLFINKYPKSDHLPEANKLLNEMDLKLEIKAFNIAKQYHLISDYKAAITSINLFLFDYPLSKYKEEAQYYRLDAAYELAINSVLKKKKERLNTALSYCSAFQNTFLDSRYLEEVAKRKEELNTHLQEFN